MARRRWEVAILENDEPVLLCRRRMDLPPNGERQPRNYNIWKTVDPPTAWVETCETLERAQEIAGERSTVLNRLAQLFDADTAVSLYKRWEGEIR